MNKPGVGFYNLFISVLFLLVITGCSSTGRRVDSLEAEAERLYKTGSYDSSFSYYKQYLDSLKQKDSPLLVQKTLSTGRLLILHAKFNLFDHLPDIQKLIKDSSETAELFRLRGEKCLQTDDLVNAEKYFNISSGISMQIGDTSAYSRILNFQAELKLTQNKFEESRQLLDQCSSLIRSTIVPPLIKAENLSGFGNYYYRTGSYNEALKFYARAFNLYDSLNVLDGKAKALNNMGNSCFRLFRIENALLYFNSALKVRQSIFGEQHPHTADTYNNLGLIYDYFGEPDRAIDYYSKALSVREKIFGRESRVVGKTLTNYANALKDFGEYAKAESLYIKSINIFEKFNKNDPDIAIICINLGEVLAGQEKFDDAIKYLERAVNLLTANYGEKHLWTAMAKLNLSISCWSAGNFHRAALMLNSSYETVKSIKEAGPVLAEILTEYGFRESSGKNYSKALIYYKEALDILAPGQFNNPDSLPDPRAVPNDKRIIRLLTYQAEALAEINPGYLKDAYNYLKAAGAVIENIRMGFKEESSGVLLGNEVRETYAAAIGILYRMYEREGDQSILNEAFRIFEKSKSAVLLSRNIELRAKNAAGIPDSLLEQERLLKMKITAINVSDDESEKDQLLPLKQKYLQLLDIYQRDYPVFYRLKFNTDVVPIKQVQKDLLRQGENCISYFVTEKNIYSILITKDVSRFIRVPVDLNIADAIASYRKGMLESNYEIFSTSAYKLYQLLVFPLEQWVDGNALIIIPDGVLSLAAFDTFIDSPPGDLKGDYKKLKYLIYKYRISYAYSCSLLLENLSYNTPGGLNTTLGFAPY